METEIHRFEKFIFRIIDVPEHILNNMDKIMDNYLFKTKSYYKDKSLKVLSVELKEGIDYSDFISLVKSSKVERKKCGVYSSLVTDRDTSGVAVPDFIVDIYLEIGYTLDFSFTVV